MQIKMTKSECFDSRYDSDSYSFQCGIIQIGQSNTKKNNMNDISKLQTIFSNGLSFKESNIDLRSFGSNMKQFAKENYNIEFGNIQTYFIEFWNHNSSIFNPKSYGSSFEINGSDDNSWSTSVSRDNSSNLMERKPNGSVDYKVFVYKKDCIRVCIDENCLLYFEKNNNRLITRNQTFIDFNKYNYLFALSSVRCECPKQHHYNVAGFEFDVSIV